MRPAYQSLPDWVKAPPRWGRVGAARWCRRARHSLRVIRQPMQDARPASRAFVEAFQIIFFIGRMDGVVILAEANKHGVHAKDAAEVARDGDRSAAADEGRRVWPFLGEGLAGGLKGRVGVIHDRGGRGTVALEFDATILGEAGLYEIAECIAQFQRV